MNSWQTYADGTHTNLHMHIPSYIVLIDASIPCAMTPDEIAGNNGDT